LRSPANAPDIDVDDVGRWIEIQFPNLLQQQGPRYDLTRVAHEIFKHLEFPRQSSISWPARLAVRATRSSSRSPTRSTVSFVTVVLRRADASMRASNYSANANGFTR
jgi:hypothetical protein